MQLLHNSSTLQAPPSGLCSNKQVIMLRSEGLGVPLGGSEGLVAAKFVKCPKSYYTEQFEEYG
jgi:hypothetical protein